MAFITLGGVNFDLFFSGLARSADRRWFPKQGDRIDRMSTEVITPQAGLERPPHASLRVSVGRVLCVIVPPIIWFAPLHIEPVARHGLAITSFMLLAWITEAMDYALAGLIGCYLYWALNVAPFNVAFGGFATDTPWFLLGAILFGTMATKSGLARRVAILVTQRVGNTYSGILLGLIITRIAILRANPDFVAIVPNKIAPNKN